MSGRSEPLGKSRMDEPGHQSHRGRTEQWRAEDSRDAHVHGVANPVHLTTARGLQALKWSLGILGIAAMVQLCVVVASGSVALLADTIHNAADACTAIPLGIAFVLMRRTPSARFTYGYGRVEDLAGVAIVLVILASALAAGYEAVRRLIDPHPISALGAVGLAGAIGFLANEAAARIRIRTGREIHSAALVADGYHARVDAVVSLSVSAGAIAVKLGFPIADPIIGFAIAAAILGIVWDSARTVFTRLLDGVEPDLAAEICHAGEHVAGIGAVLETRARWLGHRLHAEADIAVDSALSVREGIEIAERFRREVMTHLPELAALHVGIVDQGAQPAGADASRPRSRWL
ncbi:MAG TPA: cation diffusion facilitator family transporter [Candidatus Binataceae bacterium]|nr:cation diffusion facilitator family transporter [Candidatus Binataceae bacterium]HYB89410.1 cation diffusion facilitator family transporter [Candidatus Binataceae bacterium]